MSDADTPAAEPERVTFVPRHAVTLWLTPEGLSETPPAAADPEPAQPQPEPPPAEE